MSGVEPSQFAPVAVIDRNGVDESIHFGAVVCLDQSGDIAFSIGDPQVLVYPRSSTKPLQALAMVRSGLTLPPEQLALVCASHNGEKVHLDTARAILATAGLDIVKVNYSGSGPALKDLAGGQIQAIVAGPVGTLPLVKDGKLRALAVTSAKRVALVPDLPTLQEAGVAGYEMIGWNGLFVPAGTPRDIVAKLHDASAKVLRRPDVIEQLAKLGAESVGNPQPEFAAFVQAETDRWGRIIRDKGIKPE